MAADDEGSSPFAEEFAAWARDAPGLAGTPDEGALLFDLLRDYLGVFEVTDLEPMDLRELLLHVYPRKVAVRDPADASDTIPTARDILRFVADRGREDDARALGAELDEIEPVFAGNLMDPANWGMARSFAEAMTADGIDFDDQSAVDSWLAGYNAALTREDGDWRGPGETSSEDASPYPPLDGAMIREALGLPDRLPPIRLPAEARLAAMARANPLLARMAELAKWADGKAISATGELAREYVTEAAALLGVDEPPGAASVYDVPGLLELWQAADCAYFLGEDEEATHFVADEAAEAWPDVDDEEALTTWSGAFGHLLGHSLPDDDQDGDFGDLNLGGAGMFLAIGLLLAGKAGLDRAECRSLLRDAVTGELSGAAARRTWAAWRREHGDMTDTLVRRLAAIGAVEADGDAVRLTPLAVWDIRQELDDVIEIPLLPPVAEMTAADLLAFARQASEEELDEERQAWFASRPGDEAARQLFDLAASGEPVARVICTSLAGHAGAAAEPLWRAALDDPLLRPYAKIALTEAAGGEPAAGGPGLELSRAEIASMLADSVVSVADGTDRDDLPAEMKAAIPPQHEEELLDLMRRSENPAARQALELVGRHHPDKRIAKAARKASFKAASGQR